MPTTLTPDVSGPTVSQISLSSYAVNTGSGAQSITASVTVSDATGLDLSRLPRPYWFNVSDVSGTRINSDWALQSGTSTSAVLTTSIAIPAGAKPGNWSVGCTAFYDTLGYSSTNGGYERGFTVSGNSSVDTSGPVVSPISLSSYAIDVSSGAQSITASVTVSDATGLDLSRLPRPYWFNVSDVSGTRINSDWTLQSGTSTSAVLTTSITIAAGAKSGNWSVGCTAFYDTLGYASTNGGYGEGFTVSAISTSPSTPTSGDDMLRGGSGFIDGGLGIDTVVYSSTRGTLARNPDGTFSFGAETLANVERLQFADVKLALDIDGHAGTAAKILGAVFGPAAIQNRAYVGIGLNYLDGGMSYEALVQLALSATGAVTPEQVVAVLYRNVVGATASASEARPFVDMLNGGMGAGALGVFAAETDLNKINIGIVGLQQTGIEFI